MKLEVKIPDELYSQVQRFVYSNGISVDRFMSDAVRLHLSDDLEEPQNLKLSLEQVTNLREAQAAIKSGGGLTIRQVEQRLADKKTAWLQADKH